MRITAGQDRRAQVYGREIFARLDHGGPVPFGPAWWDDRLMEATMGDEALKAQLFRFVDALPLLKTPTQVTRHLVEYLSEADVQLPWWARLGTHLLPQRGLAGRLLAHTARTNAERLARRFIAGGNVSEALEAIARLRRRSLASTLDLLGEATITEAEADRCQAEYLELLEGLSHHVNTWQPIDLIDRDRAGPLPRVNVSIKLSALYSQFDPVDAVGTSRAVLARLRPVLRAARKHGAFVNFDMEQYTSKDLTLAIFREVLSTPEFRDWADVGIAIQAYLRDAPADLDALARWAEQRGTSVQVRLIKGAYWDYETLMAAQQGWPVPVFTGKAATDACYEEMTCFLLERHRHLRPAFGSHNVRSLALAMAVAESMGLPADGYEVQMLYGMADPIKDVLVGMGRRVRVYTPYGQLLPGMAYLVRRLLENTANESFLRASFTEHVAEEVLLMNPLTARNGTIDHAVPTAAPVPSPGFVNEPLTEFHREPSRLAMQRALEQAASRFGRTYPPIIAGKAVATAETLERTNPSHVRQIVGRTGKATAAQARQAVEAARSAFPAWRDTPISERAALLLRLAAILRRRRFELAAWQVHETGKPWREADGDVAEAIDFCVYYAQEMQRLARPRHRDVPGETNETLYEPRGVAVVIAPWNFPLAILCGMTTAALVAGNTVVMKPAEQSGIIGALFMEALVEAGVPPGVVNYLPGVGEEVGPALVQHRDVALIAFTGSRGVGLGINREATEVLADQAHIKKVITELGGKNAIIVDEDADLDEAVQGVAASAFGYSGQKCSACSRAIVVGPIHDGFVARLVEAARSLKVAPAEEPGSSVGPVIDDEARRRIVAAFEQGQRDARLVFAGDPGALAGEGHYVGPHVFADVPPGSALAQEEIFGPVLAVLKADDLAQALAIANGTPFALTGGLYTRSPASIARTRREFRVGNLYINRRITGALVDRQPFGGFGLSGGGTKAGGPDYLLHFLLPRTITENTMRRGFAPRAANPTSTSPHAEG